MWNPFEDMKSGWTGATSVWGKVAVIGFYLAAWAMIILNIFCLINPAKFESFACPYDEAHHSVAPYSYAMLREWELFIVAFFCYALKFGLTVGNLLWVNVVYAASGTIATRFARVNTDPDFDCVSSFAPYGWAVSGVLVAALISLVIDDRIKNSEGSAAERQPLSV